MDRARLARIPHGLRDGLALGVSRGQGNPAALRGAVLSYARVPFPISTFGDAAGLGLVLKIWCLGCKRYGTVDLADTTLVGRRFAGARFRCRRCFSLGAPSLVPAERLAGSSVIHADVFCQRCVPPWEIREVRFDRPPWSAIDTTRERYRCPGCAGLVGWIWHGRPRMPFTGAPR